MIIPSIDLADGKAVQLKQGKQKVLDKDNVLELAKYFALFGDIAVIDLDRALNTGRNNDESVKKICKIAPCRVGGGIRTLDRAKEVLSWGAKKIIIGTAADEEFLSELPKSKVIVAIDSSKGKITTNGWTIQTEIDTLDYIKRFEDYTSEFLYTIVDKEGMMQGCDIDLINKAKNSTKVRLTAAGGISTYEEIVELNKNNINTQLGMCIYTDNVKLDEAFIKCLNFDKYQDKLIPTVVQDFKTKQVLMLAYSSKESLKAAFEKRLGIYYSRSGKSIWQKGETSGNTQELLSARFDCDNDAVLFTVNQKGNACHLNRFSCFNEKDFTFQELFDLITDRKEKLPQKSYTTKLFNDEFYLKRKIMEEAFETVNFEYGDGLGWEAADLIYHLFVFMAKNNITIDDVKNNLASRTK